MDWKELKEQFKNDYQSSQVSLKQWCIEQGVDYSNARKHISVRDVKEAIQHRSKTKRQNVKVSQPNKANDTSFSKGNQVARRHGAYSALLDCDDVEVAIEVQSLDDELLVCRSRLASVLKTRSELQAQWHQCTSVESKIQLSEVLTKLVDAEERTIARIESLNATMSKLKRDEMTIQKDELQVQLIEQTLKERKKIADHDNQVVYHIDW
ncbi:hypothetical protein [Vibrio brasiliensis]|uniref:Putative small subunit bacteriophage terminase n=1 Tax=Vibrio brasiliensis LMG 20546 TaxID=945543 RepID=E8LYR7_9VIBR|nr:hypothetical protein [Vibrio brasiliensis]EGA64181.1 putative small subunit bacteriophage terminase [Vibrio brasiliensis LMG 20546]